jgi:hypothetical protein
LIPAPAPDAFKEKGLAALTVSPFSRLSLWRENILLITIFTCISTPSNYNGATAYPCGKRRYDMKRITLRIALLAAATLISALPALAAEGMGMGSGTMNQDQRGGKNECLLMARNCDGQVDTIQERIGRLNHEIRKGSSVYTSDELRQLKNELEDANSTLEILRTNSGG